MPTLETLEERRRSMIIENLNGLELLEPTEAAAPEAESEPQPAQAPADPAVYGYHNIFHTHSKPSSYPHAPPSYHSRSHRFPVDSSRLGASTDSPSTSSVSTDILPSYTCDVTWAGVLGLKNELSSPFRRAPSRKWQEVFVSLRGTQLSIHKVHRPGKLARRNCNADGVGYEERPPTAGRLIRSYTLQHAEVGVALDYRRTERVPKNAFGRLIPAGARERMYETDPHLFEPVREHLFRVRVETEQIILSCPDEESMMEWVENICTGIDISHPIEDRSEPRYRSLPRRNRRQRQLELMSGIPEDDDSEAMALIAEQERIFRRLYPHLSNQGAEGDSGANQLADDDTPRERSVASQLQANIGDPDSDDLDRTDILIPSNGSSSDVTQDTAQAEPRSGSPAPVAPRAQYDPKTATHRVVTPEVLLRYRRRCAPILLFGSPRASDVLMFNGQRVRVDPRSAKLLPFAELPPRYESHKFTAKAIAEALREWEQLESAAAEPASPTSETSADSLSGRADSPQNAADTPATTPPTSAPPSLLHGTSWDQCATPDSYFTPAEEISDPIFQVEVSPPAEESTASATAATNSQDQSSAEADTHSGSRARQEPSHTATLGKGRRPRKDLDRLTASSTTEKRRSWFKLHRKVTDDETRNMSISLHHMGFSA